MKGRVSIERIAMARQRLAELSELGSGPPGSESQVRQAEHFLPSILDELETVANESEPEQEADNESRFNTFPQIVVDADKPFRQRSSARQ